MLRPTVETLALGDRRCAAPGACAPVKIAHGLSAAADGAPLDALFAPAFINLPSHGAAGTYTCPIAQGTPQMLDHALAGEPRRRLWCGRSSSPPRPTASPAPDALASSKRPAAAARRARRRRRCAPPRPRPAPSGTATSAACARSARGRSASRAPGRAGRARRGRGPRRPRRGDQLGDPRPRRRQRRRAAAARLLSGRRGGAGAALRHWAGAGETLRASLAAAAAGDVFPLLLCAYGCGPNSLVEHLFDDLLSDYPHTVLESDGHGGSAGYVTRVQAFLHAVRGYREARAQRPHGGADGAGAVRPGRPAPTGALRAAGRRVAAQQPRAHLPVRQHRRERRPLRGRRHARRRPRRAFRRGHLARRPRQGPSGLLGQGVPALPAHLGHAGRLPRARRRHHRRGRLRVRRASAAAFRPAGPTCSRWPSRSSSSASATTAPSRWPTSRCSSRTGR